MDEQGMESKNEEKMKFPMNIKNRKLVGPINVGVREKGKIKYGSKFSFTKDQVIK